MMEWEGLMYLWLILVLLFALLEAIAVSKNVRQIEYIAKPAVMIFLFLWLYTATGLQSNAFWFGLGIFSSLVGDVLLMLSLEQFFLWGLVAFLFTHIFYTIGFRDAATEVNTWSLIWLVLIAISVSRLLRRITGAMRAQGQDKLILPVIVYGAVISVMLYASISTIYDQDWKTSASFFVSLGAILFVVSDVLLAWNKFVSPLKNGRVWNILLYHLGQIGLIAGVISQFGE
jgi:uncharacterized membrane protein YhhN